MTSVRTRFAPSPTGYMHVGGVRTALFAWLLAQQAKGVFMLRLEDTDKVREVEGSAEHIVQSLRWLGLNWQEGIDIGGPYGPYRQSERLETYREWAQKLVDTGRAYADPYSATELEALREQAKAERRPFLFREHRPDNPPTWDGTQPLRFKSDPKAYTWNDAIMGELTTGAEAVDDFILMKSDGYPTYNFCHIIDDMLMEITHIIRSQEFIASTPKYLNLYEALDITPPVIATVPMVMAPDGKKKLGKRDGAKDIMDYAREGYLPEALVNFMATLGWNDGTEQEIFSIPELIEKFSLERVQKGGAQFDERRLLWLNGAHIRLKSLDELYELSRDGKFWPEEAESATDGFRRDVLSLVQERLKYFGELPELTRFFFTDLPVNPALISEHKQLKKLTPDELKTILTAVRASLAASDFSEADLTERLNALLESQEQKPAVLFSLVRIATTQAAASPALAPSLVVLGKERTLQRIDQQLAAL